MKQYINPKNRNQLLLLLLICSSSFIVYGQQALTYKPPVFADNNRLQKIETTYKLVDSLFKAYAEKNHYPGMAFGLVIDGSLVHSGAFGYTDVVKKTLATATSLFRIASMTKSFVAMAILKLRDEGKLQLDEPAYKYIPEMKGVK